MKKCKWLSIKFLAITVAIFTASAAYSLRIWISRTPLIDAGWSSNVLARYPRADII